jgi:regulator of protease activity HflC (stomatin/prohibitin superfamily)
MIQLRRGRNVAVFGGVAQLAFAAVLLVMWLWTRSWAAMACLWLSAGGVGVWAMAALVLYCRQLARQEALELEEIAAGEGAASLFEGDTQRELRAASRRLRFVERWGVPIFTLLWAGYHVAAGVLVLRAVSAGPAPATNNAAQGALFVILTTFAAFLLSFYALGMSRQGPWRVLRAPGSYTLVNVLFAAAVAAAFVAAWQGYRGAGRVVAIVIPLVQLVLAAELVLNVLLDLYRPRVPGQEERFSFDSRLFGLLADPQRVGHSIAEAVNYQFGFEVSRSWFYQLVSRTFVPLILFGALVMVGMSCIVIVREGERVVLQRFGRADPGRGTLGAGMHLKWFWPIDTARRFDVAKVHEILLGAGAELSAAERKENIIKGREIFVWTQEHGRRRELDFLVAVPPQRAGEGQKPAGAVGGRGAEGAGSEAVPEAVNIIKLVVSVQYVIDDVYDYGFAHADTRQVLEDIAYREMTSYCASATLDRAAAGGGDRPQAIMTFGRPALGETLRERIQAAADRLDLGVRILYAGAISVHPPASAAPAYEAVLEAERGIEEQRYRAEAKASRLLARAAGDPALGRQLASRIAALNDLTQLRALRGDPAEFRAALNERVQLRRQRIRSLREEIQRERLRGWGLEGRTTARTELLAEYERQLARLEAIARELSRGGPPDLSARIAAAWAEADAALSDRGLGDLGRAAGEAAVLVAAAQAERWELAAAGHARLQGFRRRRLAYSANPEVYKKIRRLEVWDEVLPDAYKIVLGVEDHEDLEVRIILDQDSAPLGVTMTPETTVNE